MGNLAYSKAVIISRITAPLSRVHASNIVLGTMPEGPDLSPESTAGKVIGATIIEVLTRLGRGIIREVAETVDTKQLRNQLFPYIGGSTELIIGVRDTDRMLPSQEDIRSSRALGVGGLLSRYVSNNSKIYYRPNLGRVLFSKDIFAIGGPVPLPYAGLLMYKCGNLPYTYGPRIRDLYEKDMVDAIRRLREDWYIEDNRGTPLDCKPWLRPLSDGSLHYPIDQGIILKTDVINPSTMKPVKGRFCYVFSGCHYEGTRGTVEVFRRKELLKKLYEKLELNFATKHPGIRFHPEICRYEILIECRYDHHQRRISEVEILDAQILD